MRAREQVERCPDTLRVDTRDVRPGLSSVAALAHGVLVCQPKPGGGPGAERVRFGARDRGRSGLGREQARDLRDRCPCAAVVGRSQQALGAAARGCVAKAQGPPGVRRACREHDGADARESIPLGIPLAAPAPAAVERVQALAPAAARMVDVEHLKVLRRDREVDVEHVTYRWDGDLRPRSGVSLRPLKHGTTECFHAVGRRRAGKRPDRPSAHRKLEHGAG